MSEERKLVIDRDESRIETTINRHKHFVSNLNRILEKVNQELPSLLFTFDADFLNKMITGELSTSGGVYFGGSRFKRMIDEAQVRAKFGGDGLELDVEKLTNMMSLPALSKELDDLFAAIHQGLDSSIRIEFVKVKDGKFILPETSIDYFESEYSTVLRGEEVEVYEAYQAIADQLNELDEKYHSGTGPGVERLIGWTMGKKSFIALNSCVPSQLRLQNSAMVAAFSMSGAPEPQGVNGEVAGMFLFDPGAPKPGLGHFADKK